ncbi:MAG: molybdopterin-dependent oxidoreductase [Chloroflexi bacterium]|nr:molybdopterin-dependent oxidoreductase [Chloroflexota bacterium]
MGTQDRLIASRAFVAGLAAAVLAAAFGLALRFALGAPTLQEVITDKALSLMPAALFEFFLEHLWHLGKPLLFAGLTALLILLGGGVGYGYGWLLGRLGPRVSAWRLVRGLFLALFLWLLTVLIVVPLAGGGFFGTSVPGGAPGFPLALFAAVAVYGMGWTSLYREVGNRVAPGGEAEGTEGVTRRVFLRRTALVAVALGVVGFGVRSLISGIAQMRPSRVNTRDAGILPPEVTPNDRFYVVSKNVFDPEVDANGWRLRVEGLVQSPFALTYEELKAMPATTEIVTLECISNPVGGDLISNAEWKGVPLRALLEKAGLQSGVRKVVFHAADGYSDSISLEHAFRQEIIVAYQMNGEPLPVSHGFPARIVVPGLYGLKSVKWLSRIETVDVDYQGFWQKQGWSDSAEVQTTSQILVPASGLEIPPSPVKLGGVAFSGAKGISQVEVSADGGKTWMRAEIRKALSPFTWVLWTGEWHPQVEGRHRLLVRAVDGKGVGQVSEVRGAAPDGATGYHSISVLVGQG